MFDISEPIADWIYNISNVLVLLGAVGGIGIFWGGGVREKYAALREADSRARIAAADASAAAANRGAALANQEAGRANERAAVIERETAAAKVDLAKAQSDAARANERAAQLEKEAEEARLELEKIRERQSQRRISAADAMAALWTVKDVDVEIFWGLDVEDEGEMETTAKELAVALGFAGWKVTKLEGVRAGIVSAGIAVFSWPEPQPGDRATEGQRRLLGFLNSKGLRANQASGSNVRPPMHTLRIVVGPNPRFRPQGFILYRDGKPPEYRAVEPTMDTFATWRERPADQG